MGLALGFLLCLVLVLYLVELDFVVQGVYVFLEFVVWLVQQFFIFCDLFQWGVFEDGVFVFFEVIEYVLVIYYEVVVDLVQVIWWFFVEIVDEVGFIGLYYVEMCFGLYCGYGYQCLGIGLVMCYQGVYVDIGNVIVIGEYEIVFFEIVVGGQ